MKKVLTTILLATIIIGGFSAAGWYESHYTREAEIISSHNGIVKAEDNRGNIWEFEAEGLEVGNEVRLEMYTNHTETIYDDEVEDYKVM